MQVYKTEGTVAKNIFHKILKDYPGGVAVDPSELGVNSNVLKKGTLLEVDWTNRKGHIVKTAEVHANYTDASDTGVQVKKGHEFLVGDNVFDGTADAAITSIDRTNADYDILDFGAAASLSGDIAAGSIIEQGDGAAAAKYTPNAIAGTEEYVEDRTSSNISTAAIIGGVVYKDNLPYPMDDGTTVSDHKGSLEPEITFI